MSAVEVSRRLTAALLVVAAASVLPACGPGKCVRTVVEAARLADAEQVQAGVITVDEAKAREADRVRTCGR
ncbi:hypothetical protein DMP17_22045 [Pseudonocardia sp. TMWB2A]|uniref:hypothetical protein n=1 Tax=Pseudonocardia sp. TMWB2A TaxID=687430 RepID=UPI00307F78AB